MCEAEPHYNKLHWHLVNTGDRAPHLLINSIHIFHNLRTSCYYVTSTDYTVWYWFYVWYSLYIMCRSWYILMKLVHYIVQLKNTILPTQYLCPLQEITCLNNLDFIMTQMINSWQRSCSEKGRGRREEDTWFRGSSCRVVTLSEE